MTAAAIAVTLVGSATAAGAAVVVPPPSTASVSAGTLRVLAGAGHANAITVFHHGAEIRVRDALRPIVAHFPCQNLTANVVRCPAGAVQRLTVRLGDRDDTARNATNRPSALSGDAGNDVLTGALARDDFRGGIGQDRVSYQDRAAPVVVRVFDSLANDGRAGEQDNVRPDVEDLTGGAAGDVLIGSGGPNRLLGLGGADVLSALGGNDTLDGGTQGDRLSGGLGVDTASYASRAQALFVRIDDLGNDGQLGEGDDVRSDVENVIGGSHDDRLIGSAAANVLQGRSGNDRLEGLGGADVLVGGLGVDAALGGAGVDACSAELRISCP